MVVTEFCDRVLNLRHMSIRAQFNKNCRFDRGGKVVEIFDKLLGKGGALHTAFPTVKLSQDGDGDPVDCKFVMSRLKTLLQIPEGTAARGKVALKSISMQIDNTQQNDKAF